MEISIQSYFDKFLQIIFKYFKDNKDKEQSTFFISAVIVKEENGDFPIPLILGGP